MEIGKVQRIISQTEIIIMDGIGKINKECPSIPTTGIERTSLNPRKGRKIDESKY